jgi:uncharacterized RDD family membrane protein YckC
MFCVKCGTKNPAGAQFCFNCGTAIVQPPATSDEQPATGYQPSAISYQPPATSGEQPAIGYPLSANPEQPVTNYQQSGYPDPTQGFSPAPSNAPWFAPYDKPVQEGDPILEFHPLARGLNTVPVEVLATPKSYYSYLNADGKLVFARRAEFPKRFGAGIVDAIIMIAPYFCIIIALTAGSLQGNLNAANINNAQITASAGWAILATVLIAFAYILGTARGGQSVGKKFTKLRVMRLDGKRPDWKTIVMRYLLGYPMSANIFGVSIVALVVGLILGNLTIGGAVALLAFGWGFWTAGWDELKQGWHDKLARTLVVDTQEYVEGTHFYRG